MQPGAGFTRRLLLDDFTVRRVRRCGIPWNMVPRDEEVVIGDDYVMIALRAGRVDANEWLIW